MRSGVLLSVFLLFLSGICLAHSDSSALYRWQVHTTRQSSRLYEINFYTDTKTPFILYAPNQLFSDYQSTQLHLRDSSIIVNAPKDSGKVITFSNPLFENRITKGYRDGTNWKFIIEFKDRAPANLSGELVYTYGKGEELYPSVFPFTVPLDSGIESRTRIRISSIDMQRPVSSCGDEEVKDKGLLSIFFIGMLGGLVALFTPCVFPMIPTTISVFANRNESKGGAIKMGITYAFFIFAIYALLSLPFHFLNGLNPEILNIISTNVWLNLTLFLVFLFFALSFFGLFEIRLPSIITNPVGAKSEAESVVGLLFMALTLAVVSFSCTGPILGSLLAGAISKTGGALQLSFGMAGFGAGLALPFALFSLFPQAVRSLPKRGDWLTTIKVVLGFLELALAVKFLSNADLVKQCGFLKREVFIGCWIVIGFIAIIYLAMNLYAKKGAEAKVSEGTLAFLIAFSLATAYLIPGVTNSSAARLELISGFPPPPCYSVYQSPVNCIGAVTPLHDYEEALSRAKKYNRPLLIDFTGWGCVNCRRMEELVWPDDKVKSLMRDSFILVSLYVDDRAVLPLLEQQEYTTKNGTKKMLFTIGDKWATFQAENFDAVSQPQYAIISTDEKLLTRTKAYTPSAKEFAQWLGCGLTANRKKN